MKKQPTFNDFETVSPKELQKHYKLDQRALENAHRKTVCDGASQAQMRKEYDKFYRRNRRDA
jgi:hypothetical protein